MNSLIIIPELDGPDEKYPRMTINIKGQMSFNKSAEKYLNDDHLQQYIFKITTSGILLSTCIYTSENLASTLRCKNHKGQLYLQSLPISKSIDRYLDLGVFKEEGKSARLFMTPISDTDYMLSVIKPRLLHNCIQLSNQAKNNFVSRMERITYQESERTLNEWLNILGTYLRRSYHSKTPQACRRNLEKYIALRTHIINQGLSIDAERYPKNPN